MSSQRENARFQVTMKPEIGAKIEELSERLNISQSKMIELLCEAAIEDNEWLINTVTSRWAKALASVLGQAKPQPKKA